MTMSHEEHKFWNTPKGWAACVMIFAASYFVWMEHRQHLFEFLPYLIFLLCPLMHLFMHHGHHGQADKSTDDAIEDAYLRGVEDGQQQKRRD